MGIRVSGLVEAEGYELVGGGVCAANGFKANGVHCGLIDAPEKNDLGLIVCEKDCVTAGVYTTNKVKGAPITVTKKHLAKTGGISRAVVMNCKNANTCNADGVEKAEKMCELAGNAAGIAPEKVLVASTGVIGMQLPIEPIENKIGELAAGLCREGHLEAEKAVMTTDTVPKEAAVEFTCGGRKCHLGGMAKGSGMINPHMATTLNFITTDVSISADMLQCVLSDVVQDTYNCLCVDGDMSTNDMVLVMADGMTGNKEICDSSEEDYKVFRGALYNVMMNLTRMLAADGEGATKLIECDVKGAPDHVQAVTAAKSVIGSNLFKCAVFGSDANWGRILCALGYADASYDIDKVSVSISSPAGTIDTCQNGAGIPFSEDDAKKILAEKEITVSIDLHQGDGSAAAWGCDMTYDYVKINGDYRS